MTKFLILSKHQCDYRKGFILRHCLAFMLEKWRKALDNGDCLGTLLADFLKAFNCLLHDLVIAKLHAYGFGTKSYNSHTIT